MTWLAEMCRIGFASEASGSCVVNMSFYMLMYTLEKLSFMNWQSKLVGSFDLFCVNLIHQKKVRIHAILFSVFRFSSTSSMRAIKKSLKKSGCVLKQNIKPHIKPQEKCIEFLLKYTENELLSIHA